MTFTLAICKVIFNWKQDKKIFTLQQLSRFPDYHLVDSNFFDWDKKTDDIQGDIEILNSCHNNLSFCCVITYAKY